MDLAVETQDVTVETPEVEAEETEVNASPEASNDEGDKTEVENSTPKETVEDKLSRLERETAGKQKAIDRKTAAYHALQRKYDEQRQEHEKISASMEQQKPQSEPVIDNYETHDEYVNALVDYRAKSEVQKQQQALMDQQQQFKQQQLEGERTKIRQSQEAEFLQENPMYKTSSTEVEGYMNGLVDVPLHTVDAVAMQLYQGNVPSVINYFGENNGERLEELGNISRMTPPEAAVEIYKIQQKLSSSTVKKETKPKTKPVHVHKGSSSGSKPMSKRNGSEILDWVKS